jgi:hypothetical protein
MLIDLSMEVFQGMMTYPNVAKPVIVEMESYTQMARSVGTDQYGVDEITNHCMIVTAITSARTSIRGGTSSPTRRAPRGSRSSTATAMASCSI